MSDPALAPVTGSADADTTKVKADPNEAPFERDWIEDADHENGQYYTRCTLCHQLFVGHKRRVVCKECASKPNRQAEGRGSEEGNRA